MLISFFVLYGVGNIVYFAGADDTVPDIRDAVTVSLIMMWIGLVIGLELARASLPSLNARSELVVRRWRATAISDRSDGNQLLAAVEQLIGTEAARPIVPVG